MAEISVSGSKRHRESKSHVPSREPSKDVLRRSPMHTPTPSRQNSQQLRAIQPSPQSSAPTGLSLPSQPPPSALPPTPTASRALVGGGAMRRDPKGSIHEDFSIAVRIEEEEGEKRGKRQKANQKYGTGPTKMDRSQAKTVSINNIPIDDPPTPQPSSQRSSMRYTFGIDSDPLLPFYAESYRQEFSNRRSNTATQDLLLTHRNQTSTTDVYATRGNPLTETAQRRRINLLFPMFPARGFLAPVRGTRVELHAHLEGSLRYTTIWELMKEKNLDLPGNGSLREMTETLIVHDPMSLTRYSQPVPVYLQAIAGDLRALERVAYEFCEDKVQQNVLYVEARYTPHMLLGHRHARGKDLQDLSEVIMAVTRGFRLAEAELGIVARSILCVVVGMGIARDIINLCQRFQDQGVVGIDLMLSYETNYEIIDSPAIEEVPITQEETKAFQIAMQSGIHRTVHAGQVGSGYMVLRALEKYRAQRVGHGYEAVKLPSVYKKCLDRQVHFECCAWESLLTRAVDPNSTMHPIVKFVADGANFGLSTGHPTLTGLTLQDEYDLVSSWGLTEIHLVRANVNALRSSFLRSEEKTVLIEKLRENLGLKLHRRY